MTAPGYVFVGEQPAPPRRPPGVVYAAAIVTWVAATSTAVLTLLLAVSVLVFLDPFFDAFDSGADNPRWFVVGAAGVVIVLSIVADLVAFFLLRARRWAQWALLGLSVVAALGGLASAFYVVPVAVTAASIAVVVLLFQPDSRAWFRESPVVPA